jgi:DNA polymerase III epsilon subunit-like protein
MGTLIDPNTFHRFLPSTFVFDLEYVGVPNDLSRCYIWEIGAMHLLSGNKFSITMDPGIRPLPPPMGQEFADVTETFLKKKNAVNFNYGWNAFLRFIKVNSPTLPSLLISHNNFKSDKPMLEIEAKRRGVELPCNWYFLDSLLFCRKAIPKQSSYTLNDLYMNLLGKKILNNHSALPDAIALTELLYMIGIGNIHGPIYPAYCTSLQAVKWLGPSCERSLFNQNIRSLEQLVANIVAGYSIHIIKNGPISLRSFIQHYITEICGIMIGNSESISNSILEKWLPFSKQKIV